ncbi:hypothetical protein LWM68_08465 [Niabella sp. W65]|nr:hypothetical protein [Niabella sp. W65]MCH7362796.1 hypothetical protein [Niabella sp. W65]ULT38751.1 hypothetical protein KRR40_27155 [Niabella sp. I65]
MDTRMIIISIVAIIVGLALRYWMNRRRFNRNNYAGVQTFKSHEHKVVIGPAEHFIKLLGLLLALTGGFLLFIVCSNKRSAEKHRQEHVQPLK